MAEARQDDYEDAGPGTQPAGFGERDQPAAVLAQLAHKGNRPVGIVPRDIGHDFVKIGFGAAAERCFRRGFIAATTRRQKNDRRQQIVFTERGQQGRGRHFRHAKFHVISFSALPPDVR